MAGLIAWTAGCTSPPAPPEESAPARLQAPSQPRVAAPCRASATLRCIAVVAANPGAQNAATLIGDDLVRSDRFAVLRSEAAAPMSSGRFDAAPWQQRGVDLVVLVETGAGGRILKVRLEDARAGRTLLSEELPLAQYLTPRAIAHQAADVVFERITGVRGVAATSIAFVDRAPARGPAQFRLLMADADGSNLTVLAESAEPLLSPAWSPDGTQIAYMGYDRGPPAIFVKDLRNGSIRKLVSEATGVGAPAWSPDGRQIAFTVNARGGSDIFVIDVASGARRQLTQAQGIDTEAAWSPDGRTIAFTSDRGGAPQVYTMPASGGAARSLGHLGRQTLRPSYAPDGARLAMVVLQGSRFRIGLSDLGASRLRLLSDGPGDESPSFSPNGATLVYTTQAGASGRGELIALPLDGGAPRRLFPGSDVRAVAWSPFRTRRVPISAK